MLLGSPLTPVTEVEFSPQDFQRADLRFIGYQLLHELLNAEIYLPKSEQSRKEKTDGNSL